jgi:chorismate-pyruvate lyase
MAGLKRLFVAASLSLLFNAARAADPTGGRPENFVDRLESLALIETLNGRLLAGASATATLEKWCADHHMAQSPRIVARRVPGPERAPDSKTRERLQVAPDEPVKYRHVELVCGDHVLSEADNWYVPSRLSPEANRLLETGDTPFGKAIQSLRPYRRTIEAHILWAPLPEGWETTPAGVNPDAPAPVPRNIIEHRAVVFAADQTPLSEVDERYTRETLDFERPPTVAACRPIARDVLQKTPPQ